ncbi:MAG: hypothetical protein B6I34_09510 [Anaerolineaceae bacterium 4572_32.1]|nr:MAG: hypothetical protein B6I34_09510 [Anaerolineaceae bacterium 4572_32.1]HEY74343.1 hypothetical protein [Thermoflexia bacterium]
MSVTITRREYRFVLLLGLATLGIASIPYVLGAALATESRVFGGFVYAVEDGYAYLAHMREGANGVWLFTLPYTPEPHPPRLFYLFHLLLGKLAAVIPGGDLTARMVLVYHGARVFFGLGLLLTVYRFLAEFTRRVLVRQVAWLMVTFGGGLGWLLVALEQPDWLGSIPLDFILPEGFTFLVLYNFPHIALARTLLLWGILFLLKAWEASPMSKPRFPFYAAGAGICWLLMGLIVPFYIAVAWALTGAALLVLWLRKKPGFCQKPGFFVSIPWREGRIAGVTVLISAPVVAYSAWVFTSDRVYETWAAQNLILSPHPLHYLAAYGVLLALALFAVREIWRDDGPAWLPLAWVAVVPLLVYLPFNLQRRLVEGAQIPLSLLAAWGLVKISKSKLIVSATLIALSLTNVLLVAGNSLALRGQPSPIYRDAGEIAALDWLDGQVRLGDVALSSYATGNYLPARVGARVFVGHGPESIHAGEKKALAARFFDAATEDAWRRRLLAKYSVDYVFWGPSERALGGFDPRSADYLEPIYEMGSYALFEVTK